MAFRVLPLIALTIAGAACLDFDQYRVDDGGGGGSGGSPSTGGMGGADGGAGANGGAPTQGGNGAGGSGGGPPVVACYPGDVQSDTFDYQPPLNAEIWGPSDNVLIDSNQARLAYNGNDDAVLNLGKQGLLQDCYFQIEIVSLPESEMSEVFVVFSAANEYFGLRLVGHEPSGRVAGNVPLSDPSAFSEGFVRIGEQDGEVYIQTGETDNGPWIERLRRPTPAHLQSEGIFVVQAIPSGGNHTLTLDNFNTSTSE